MRAPAVLLNVVMAGCLGGFVGYTVAHRASHSAILRVQQERDLVLVREHELRSQLQEALAARAALEEESQRLQTNLTERLHRLEELAGQLARQDPARQTGQEAVPPSALPEPAPAAEERATE
jgi:chromosome segregation ATPase